MEWKIGLKASLVALASLFAIAAMTSIAFADHDPVESGDGNHDVQNHEACSAWTGICWEFDHSATGWDQGGGEFEFTFFSDNDGETISGDPDHQACWGVYWIVDSVHGSHSESYTDFYKSVIENDHGKSTGDTVHWDENLWPYTRWITFTGDGSCDDAGSNNIMILWEM